MLNPMRDRLVWTNAEMKKRLATALPWTDAELAMSPTREQEPIWHNRINNAFSPSRRTSLYGKGHVESAGHGRHRITDQGLRFIRGEDPTLQELMDSL
ncbi:winged helix-turn-helix domain-containing protein [Sphingomonas carotinifaciens]|uniref:winged helix-turn-helix domain-containing protein n=1 Tax=Sphingomonas carotinifaciens TaxID=1166323 RepID=UPI003D67BC10